MPVPFLKRLSPRTLIGRTALILLVPIVAIQLVVSFVFIQRLYDEVTQDMTESVLPSLRLIAARIEKAPDLAAGLSEVEDLARALEIGVAAEPAETAPEARDWDDLTGRVVERVLKTELPALGRLDLSSNSRRVRFTIATRHGHVVMSFDRDRASASNPHQLLVLMFVVSVIATAISFLFLKNQVRPIRQLADVAAAFGRGRIEPYAPSGALEVREAGAAFLDMRTRIERHIEQRTLLLSGVSHDLRTPLTRMKLRLSFLEDDDEVQALRRDVDEMQAMLDTFLDFARLDATEASVLVDPAELARRLVDRARAEGARIELAGTEGAGRAALRPLAVERALANLVSNALRYGHRAELSVAVTERAVRFRVEDDGPGIPSRPARGGGASLRPARCGEKSGQRRRRRPRPLNRGRHRAPARRRASAGRERGAGRASGRPDPVALTPGRRPGHFGPPPVSRRAAEGKASAAKACYRATARALCAPSTRISLIPASSRVVRAAAAVTSREGGGPARVTAGGGTRWNR